METLRQRGQRVKDRLKESGRGKQHVSGWVLPKQQTSFAPDGTWTNIDLDVTPIERRAWKASSILGYWLSDSLSAQSWEIGASVLAIGLTWREAVYCCILGSCVMALPIAFNGAPGAYLRVPFPAWIRSSFGYQFSKFAILPFLLIRPHKLKWFFAVKAFITITAATGTTIAVCRMAGGSGDIWKQEPTVSGKTRAWLIVYTLTAQTGSWSTVGTNISDFTRYLASPRTIYTQTIFFPLICVWLALLGIISASASKTLYGEYIWDPLTLASKWTSPAGRAGAFYCVLAWTIAQIGVNVSANVISVSNDMSSLFPKYIDLRRAAIIATLIGGWIMVPWKIITSAESLLNFMSSLGIFLAPIIAISISDYWLIKKRRVDVPALYQPKGRYEYVKGCNWRAAVAMIVSIGPTMPSLVKNIDEGVDIGGAVYVADLVWYYGFLSAFVVYVWLSKLWPAKESLVGREEMDGLEVVVEEVIEAKPDKFDNH